MASKDTTGAVASRFAEADQIYTQAHGLDTAWVEPVLGRGWVAFRRSRLVGLDPIAAKPWIDKGMQFAEQALALAPENAGRLSAPGGAPVLELAPDAGAGPDARRPAAQGRAVGSGDGGQAPSGPGGSLGGPESPLLPDLRPDRGQAGGPARLRGGRLPRQRGPDPPAAVPGVVRHGAVRGRGALVLRGTAALPCRLQVHQVRALDDDHAGRGARRQARLDPGRQPGQSDAGVSARVRDARGPNAGGDGPRPRGKDGQCQGGGAGRPRLRRRRRDPRPDARRCPSASSCRRQG